MQNPLLILIWLALNLSAEASTRALTFVHQPLTRLGTDMDAGIVIARVPVLTNAVPEGLLAHVASPNRILQDKSAGISDSNILSILGISLSVKLVEGAKYAVIMDLSLVADPATHGVTLDAVVASAIECINKTIIDTNVFHGDSQQVVWSLKLKADPKTVIALKKYQRNYDPRNPEQAEQPVGTDHRANAPESKSQARADDDAPPSNMIDHAGWARNTTDLNLRIKRLEAFLNNYIPLEDGVAIITEYEDGSSILAVTGSAWVLARAYVEAGQKEKALKMINWLQEYDSKSDIYPNKKKREAASSKR